MAGTKKLAFLFNEDGAASVTERGGKGFGLSVLAGLGVPVPPGFTVTTSVARAYAQHGRLPKRLEQQLHFQIRKIEKECGKQFGSAENPLLFAVRSGAEFSMPGMMASILNLGINEAVLAGLAETHGEHFAYDCYRRFLAGFAEVVFGVERSCFESLLAMSMKKEAVDSASKLSSNALKLLCLSYRKHILELGHCIPDSPFEQLLLAITAVLKSWHSPRAKAYRKEHKLNNAAGTAVNVQVMVYGNMNQESGTGVVFSRNVSTGEKELYGEFLLKAQGEDLVSGLSTPLSLENLSFLNANLYGQLCEITSMLETELNDVVDLEFTVESGKLYILQMRKASRSPEAAATIATHFVWEKRWSKKDALASVNEVQLKALKENTLSAELLCELEESGRLIASGLPASAGLSSGRVVFSSGEAVDAAKNGEAVILLRPDTSPDDLAGMLAATALITMKGGATCHAAVVARALAKPAVVACGSMHLAAGELITVDGRSGSVIRGEVQGAASLNKKEVNLFLKWYEESKKEGNLPELNFDFLDERVPVNLLLSDFYITDAMARAAAGTRLESEALLMKELVHKAVADRLATYLLMAVVGEIRFCYGPRMFQRLAPEVETELMELVKEYAADEYLTPVQKLKDQSKRKQLRFLDLAARVFEAKVWGTVKHSGVGGKKWALISRAAQSYLNGRVNASVFADHAFDLEHNGGTVMNKHHMILLDKKWDFEKQLEAKKLISDVSELFFVLTVHCPFVSAQVKDLFYKGVAFGLWQGDYR